MESTLKCLKIWYRQAHANYRAMPPCTSLVASASVNIKCKLYVEVNRVDSAMRKARYHDLSDFQCGIIIAAHEMGHSLSKIEVKF